MIAERPAAGAEHGRLVMMAGVASVGAAVLLIAVKFGTWLATDSVSVLASLVDSLMDSLASVLNLLAIRYSLVPADAEHRFGHGKAEALAGLGQALFIAASAVYLFVVAVTRTLDPQPIASTGLGVGVMVFSIVATLALVAFQRHVVRRTGSTAIAADSLHYVTDVAVNASIIVALIAARFGYLRVDGVVGLIIAVYIVHAAWRIAREAIQLLLDREIPGDVREAITAIVLRHPTVLGLHDLRTRQSGRTRFIQLHVDMDQDMSLLAAHDLAEQVEQDILERFPDAQVIIHLDPVPAPAADAQAPRGG